MSLGRRIVSLVTVVCLLKGISAQDRASIVERNNLCVTVNVTTQAPSYTCNSTRDIILWRVGSLQVSGSDERIQVNTTERDPEGFLSTILFTPTFLEDMADGSAIQVSCLTRVGLLRVNEGDNRTLVVFASPPSPENLRVLPTSTPLVYRVEWSKPASVGPCPDVVYQVTIRNNVTGAIERNAVGALTESFTYNDMDSIVCQLHQFEVVTSVGEAASPPSITQVALPISPNVERINARATPILEDDEILIELLFNPATTCDEMTYPIQNYMISIPQLPTFSRDVPYNGQNVALNLSSPEFTTANYSIIISACSSFGCRSANPLIVLTSEVQDASITFLNTTVSLTCEFTVTGSATGCRFSLELASGDIETLDIVRPDGGGPVQMCATTQNNREAYISFVVQTLNSQGEPEDDLPLEPAVNETQDLPDIAPCEPTPPEVVTDVVEKSTLSSGEIAAIIIVVLVVFLLLVLALVGIAWWKRQTIASAYKNWVHPLTEEEGIDLMIEEKPAAMVTDKPTIMMLMNNLVPGRGSTTTTMTAMTAAKKKTLTREESQQPDMAVSPKAAEAEMKPMKTSGGAEPEPPLSGKEPVASLKVMDPDQPNTIRLLLKPAMLAKVVHMWRSKANRGEEMLLYWKEDEEDVDDDEPYYQDSDEEDS